MTADVRVDGRSGIAGAPDSGVEERVVEVWGPDNGAEAEAGEIPDDIAEQGPISSVPVDMQYWSYAGSALPGVAPAAAARSHGFGGDGDAMINSAIASSPRLISVAPLSAVSVFRCEGEEP